MLDEDASAAPGMAPPKRGAENTMDNNSEDEDSGSACAVNQFKRHQPVAAPLLDEVEIFNRDWAVGRWNGYLRALRIWDRGAGRRIFARILTFDEFRAQHGAAGAAWLLDPRRRTLPSARMGAAPAWAAYDRDEMLNEEQLEAAERLREGEAA